MKRRLTILALTALAVVALVSVVLTVTSPVHAGGATQISGVGEFSTFTECDDPEGVGADFANRMTGDLVGCLYVFVEAFEDSPSGTYRERGTNLFVGIYNGEFGTFEATYQFTAKFGKDGEIWGRCHHPFVAGSGTGVFDGVTGRFDMQDYIKDGIVVNFPYRGHLLW